MIAAYLRVSTDRQKTDLQRREIQAWAKTHDMKELVWYEDRISGKNTKRPGLDALRADIFAGKIKTVIIWKLDRLGRTMIEAMNLIADWCNQNVRLISVTQQIDLNDTIGHMIAAVLLGVAEKEIEHIKERQAAGIAVAKEKGVYKGRKSGTTKVKPARAKKLRQKGLKISEIATSLGVTERTIKRYLKT